MTKRRKTKSKNFYDDEVLLVEDGEVHLRIGVKRLNYGTELNYNYWRGQKTPTGLDSYIVDIDEVKDEI